MDKPGDVHNIPGELYAVDDSTLKGLDILEGVTKGLYYKKDVQVAIGESSLSASSETAGAPQKLLTVTSYFYPPKEELMVLEKRPEYGDAEHAMYQPIPFDRQIAMLCDPSLAIETRGPHPLS